MSTQSLEINKNSYVAFDATSLRDLIVERLNKNTVFTDQNYIGSNISSIIEIISYSFSTLMFYLNKTSTESMFTESMLYENMNRIVKLIGYNPIGCQTASVDFNLTAKNIIAGSYTIPRYSYTVVGDSVYSFNRDISFVKSVDILSEEISNTNTHHRLYQGRYLEYPEYTARGSINELIRIAVDDTTLIDHFNIDVYVRNYKTGIWAQWSRVDNLFSYSSRDTVYEIRLNENKRYEIKFGDNINGQALNLNDIVSIFYLSSLGPNGEIGAYSLNGTSIFKYNSSNYNSITSNISNKLTDNQYNSVAVTNSNASTNFTTYESVEDIRTKAPKLFKTQNRLVTEQDYTTFIKSNYNNIISDVVVKTNDEYLAEYIKYFYNAGLSAPQLESRVLYNQLNFANSCNFNNLYIFALPRVIGRNYLMPAQKEDIINNMSPYKTLTTNIVISDPVYVAADIAVKYLNTANLSDINNTETYIELTRFNKRSQSSIRGDIQTIFEEYFNKASLTLGGTLNLYQLYNDILNIEGISKFYSQRSDVDVVVNGISLAVWNPIYPTDITITAQNISLPFFKSVYLDNLTNLINKIQFKNTSNALQNINI